MNNKSKSIEELKAGLEKTDRLLKNVKKARKKTLKEIKKQDAKLKLTNKNDYPDLTGLDGITETPYTSVLTESKGLEKLVGNEAKQKAEELYQSEEEGIDLKEENNLNELMDDDSIQRHKTLKKNEEERSKNQI